MIQKVVVFGGAGFLGTYVVNELINRGYHVTVYDRNVNPLAHENRTGDILDSDSVNDSIAGADIVYNLAAMADIEDCIQNPIDAVKYNILGNTIIIDACVKNNIKRLVFSSSVYAYSKSGGIYAATKKASEDIIKNYSKYHKLTYTILQYGTLYGIGASKGNSVFNYLTGALNDKKIKYVGDGSEVREYIHVIDAAKLSVDILDSKYENMQIILTGHHPIKVADLFKMIQEMIGDVDIEYSTSVTKGKLDSHYKVTPYSYNSELPYKLTTDCYVELGTGLLQLLNSMKGGVEFVMD